MLKARATAGRDRPLFILGLSAGNLERLRAGEPILFQGADLGLPGEFLIFFGEDEQAMIRTLQEGGMELPPNDRWYPEPLGEHPHDRRG